MSRSAFTLIELLVVIALIAILAVVVILTLNPAELLKQGRDSRRLGELATLTKAISIYQTDQGGSLGVASTTYVSIPDTSPTCANLGLPSLPTGWAYACAATSTYRKTDGSGWIPVNFQAVSFHSPLGTLPVDPLNTTSTGNYYTYTPGSGGKYEIAASLEAGKDKLGGGADKTSTDGGSYPDLYEIGSSLSLLPVDYGDPALVGYWKFDEGTGTTAYDASGRGNNLAWSAGSPTWSTSDCVQNACLSEPGDGGYFNITSNALLSPTGNLSLISWFQAASSTTAFWLLKNGEYGFQWKGTSAALQIYDGQYHGTAKTSWNLNQWYQITMVINGSTANVYINGVLDSTFTADARSFISAFLGIGDPLGNFVGLVDETRLYNRALSAAEIQAIYNATK